MTYEEKLEAAGHVLKRDEYGDIDIWVMDIGYHNGPGCVNCGGSWCQHCENPIKPCIGKEAAEAKAKAARHAQYIKLKEEFEGGNWRIIGPDWSPCFWSNEFGWVDDLSDADTFTELEKAEYKLPMYGRWMEIKNES